MNKIIKAALAVNAAALVRGIRYGPREAVRRVVESYDKIDPFGAPVEASPR